MTRRTIKVSEPTHTKLKKLLKTEFKSIESLISFLILYYEHSKIKGTKEEIVQKVDKPQPKRKRFTHPLLKGIRRKKLIKNGKSQRDLY